ncbi:YcnI family protein [Frankia sp. AiPs1]|uniref:YcnI family copper-binding membrane protein n=1 Tax=Frankia sp. AiPs1 TaxID=573493 RepID=UPI0020441E2E|nr:YcnI family protein [Frankia sp. AiPs1]MCM3921376.1 YcnI family protein [Frankia sp. AiPs1]
MIRLFRRASVLGVVAGTAVLAMTLPASAHVTVQPSTASAGSYATLSFKVPTEEDNASTTGIDVQFPVDTPLASVSVQPKAGWTYKVAKAAPAKPLSTDDGQVNEVVTRITWTAQGSEGIKPGEFDTFTVSAGPLPEKAGQLTFKTLQTYSNGDVVRWVDVAQPGAGEPEKPAPSLTVTAAGAGAGSSTGAHDSASMQNVAETSQPDGSDGTARWLGIVGVVLGALGLLAGAFALVTSRRRA